MATNKTTRRAKKQLEEKCKELEKNYNQLDYEFDSLEYKYFALKNQFRELKAKYEHIITTLNHDYRANLSSLEGLFLIALQPDHEQFKPLKKALKKAKREMDYLISTTLEPQNEVTVQGYKEVIEGLTNVINFNQNNGPDA